MRTRFLILLALLFAFTGYSQNIRMTTLTITSGATNGGHWRVSGSTTAVGGFQSLAGLTNSAGHLDNAGVLRQTGGSVFSAGATNTAHWRITGWLENNTSTNTGHGQFLSTVGIDGALTLGAAAVFPDNVRQTLNPGVTVSGLNVGSIAGDPGTPINGDIWYDSTGNTLDARINGATVNLGAAGAGGGAPTNSRAVFYNSIASYATNLTHATHNEFVMDGPRYGRMSMGANMVLGFIPPASATEIGIIATLRVLSTAGEITFSNITGRAPVPLNTGTNMFYFHWDGTNYWVEAGQNATTGGGSHLVLSNAPTILNAVLTTPVIASFASSTHTHQNSAGGGTLDAAAIAAGTVATARLGSGTANASTFLRGDQTWAAAGAGSAAFVSTNVYVTNTAAFVLKLAEFDKFMVFLETNATLILSNASTLTKRAQIYFQQDTNGTRTVDLTVAGGLLQTNAVMTVTSNANALDLLEIMPGFFDTNLVAWWPQNFQPRIGFTNSLAGGSAACATTDTSLAHDQLLEGWQNSGAENTWNSWVGTDTVTFNADFDTSALTTGKDTGACDRGVQVTVSTTAGDESVYWDRGSAVTIAANPTRFTFEVYVTTAPDNGENFTIVSINTTATGSGSVNTWVNLRNNGGTLEVQAEGNSSSAWVALTANSWNTVVVDLAAVAAASTITVNGGTPQTYTYLGTTWQYFHYGAVQNHALNENAVYVLDLLAIDFP